MASVIYLFYLVPSSWSGQSENPKINQSEQLTAARLKKEKAHYKTLQSNQLIPRISQTYTEKREERIYCRLLPRASYTYVFIVQGLRSQSLHRQQC